MNPEPRYQIIPLNIYALELMDYRGGVCCSFVLCVRLKLLFYGMNLNHEPFMNHDEIETNFQGQFSFSFFFSFHDHF